MLRITKTLTGVSEADKLIASEISERIIRLLCYNIAEFKTDPDEQVKRLTGLLWFPEKYPEGKWIDKLEELREKLVSRKYVPLDSIDKYILFNMLVVYTSVMEDENGTTIVEFDHKEHIEDMLYKKYGTLKDRFKFLQYYEDYSHYASVIFETLGFFEIEDYTEEQLIELELKEILNN